MSEDIKPKFTLEETVAEKDDKCIRGLALSGFNILSAFEISCSALNKRVVKKMHKALFGQLLRQIFSYMPMNLDMRHSLMGWCQKEFKFPLSLKI